MKTKLEKKKVEPSSLCFATFLDTKISISIQTALRGGKCISTFDCNLFIYPSDPVP